MAKTYDAVIIGAGIIGPSTAYSLSKGGLTNIALIDSHLAGGQATRATAAMVMHQTGLEKTTELSKLSIQKYTSFQANVGYDIKFKKSGSVLFTTTQEGKQFLEKQAAMQLGLGIPSEQWDGNKLQKATHGMVNPDGILLGIYCSEDGYIDANLAVQAYLSEVKKNGGEVIENSQVTKIITNGGKVEAVETSNGDKIYTKIAINCAGSYANDIANTVGITIPIKPSYKCLGVLGSKSLAKEEFPIVEDIDLGWYFRPHDRGVLVGFGMGECIEDKDRQEFPVFNPLKEAELREYASVRTPSLTNLPLVEKWAGYRPMLDPKFEDSLPIIGPVDGVEGYFNNCGYGEFGITHGTIGGELLANIILGKKSSIDTKQFLLSRFSRPWFSILTGVDTMLRWTYSHKYG